MKKKNFFALLISIVMMFSVLVSTGCVSYEEDQAGERLTLQVYNYNGGVGSQWLKAAAVRFEVANKDRTFANGKKGVLVKITNEDAYPMDKIDTLEEAVFFIEGCTFNNYIGQGTFMNINDVVTGANQYDNNKKIEDKLSENTKEALTGLNGNYYVLPHYQSYDGVQYNKSLFDQMGFYFAKNEADYKSKNPNDKGYGFVKDNTVAKTVGPNGIAGDYDDGLPSSVDELIRLCEYIKARSCKPFIYYNSGYANQTYAQKLTNSLWVSLEGYDGAMAQYKFDSNGTQTTIVTDFSGATPTTEDIVITKENAYKVYSQQSRYDALRFCEYLFSDINNFHADSMVTGEGKHLEVQKSFMNPEAKVAMLLEGTYWRNEAEKVGTFSDYPEYRNTETRFMPLPVQGTGSVTEGNGKEPTAFDTLASFSFINAKMKATNGDKYEDVVQVAKDFMKFCYSDAELSAFTVSTGVTRDLEYQLGDAYSQLNSYAKSVWDVKQNGKIVNPISGDVTYIKNGDYFAKNAEGAIWKTNIYSNTQNPCDAFSWNRETKYTAKDYFTGICATKTLSWWQNLEGNK